MLLDFDAVVDLLGADEPTVLRLIRDGDIPSPNVIGSTVIRWEASQVNDWVAAGCPKCDRPLTVTFDTIRENIVAERAIRQWQAKPTDLEKRITRNEQQIAYLADNPPVYE